MRVGNLLRGLLIVGLPLVGLLHAETPRPAVTAIPAGSVPSFAGNAQHTAVYQPAVPNLNRIRWSTTIDFNNTSFAHYGAPLVTAANTVVVPVKIPVPQPSPSPPTNGFRLDAFDGASGTLKYSQATDYILPKAAWVPGYNPCLTTGPFGTRLYYPGPGGTVYHIDNPDSAAHGPPVQETFYGPVATYQGNAAAFDSSVFINTPLTPDGAGNIYFGFRVQGPAPNPLNTDQSGFARIDPNGNGTYILASAAANDSTMNRNLHNCAPALSNDGATVYVVTKSLATAASYLVGLDSTTLAPKY